MTSLALPPLFYWAKDDFDPKDRGIEIGYSKFAISTKRPLSISNKLSLCAAIVLRAFCDDTQMSVIGISHGYEKKLLNYVTMIGILFCKPTPSHLSIMVFKYDDETVELIKDIARIFLKNCLITVTVSKPISASGESFQSDTMHLSLNGQFKRLIRLTLSKFSIKTTPYVIEPKSLKMHVLPDEKVISKGKHPATSS